jgi:3-hydroxy-9,10-secoandrosta-1,3,5(10)-triene-9,17-dione monooxygenase
MSVYQLVPRPSTESPAFLTASFALDKARQLATVFAERADNCEALRRCPSESIQDLFDAGLMRMMQPKMFGGSELGMSECLDVVLELAKVCPSTAWVFTNLASHSWTIGQLELQAQQDVWGSDPTALAATGLAFPCGKATYERGGYRVSGRWPFASGVDASTWMIVGCMTDSGDGSAPHRRFFLVPKSDFRSLDNWHAYGLTGSGSHDVEVVDAFVPEHRTVSAEIFAAGQDLPGGQIHSHPVYSMPTFVAFAYFLCIVPLGAAKGAIDQFTTSMRHRASTYTGSRVSELSSVQARIAESSACVDFAETVMRRDWMELEALTAQGDYPSLETKLKWKRNVAFASNLIVKSIDTLMPAAGAAGLSSKLPLQRLFRDVHAASAHIALTWDVQAIAYGQSAMGISPQTGLLL